MNKAETGEQCVSCPTEFESPHGEKVLCNRCWLKRRKKLRKKGLKPEYPKATIKELKTY